MSNYPFAVYSPVVGAASETFIERHINQLLPGKTLTFSEFKKDFWKPDGLLAYLNIMHEPHMTKIVELLLENKVKVLLGEYLDVSLYWCHLAKKLGIKFYVHAHGYDIAKNLAKQEFREKYQIYNQADGIIVMNRMSVGLLKDAGIREDKIHYIPYGTIPSGEESLAPKKNSPVRVLVVGRMIGIKGPILILDAFKRAQEIYPDMHLDYIGGGELFDAAEQAVACMGIKDKVTLHNVAPHSRVMEFMQKADIYIQHSITPKDFLMGEGFPVAVLEAMAHGLPVVGSKCGGMPDQIVDGETGFITPEWDTQAMGERIAELAASAQMREEFGKAAYERYLHNFTWDIERQKLLKLMGLEQYA